MNLFFILFAILLVEPESAIANIRASRMRPVPEAQHLKARGRNLEVQSEDLLVDCDQNKCRFAAIYRLSNKTANAFKLDTTFVAPVDGRIDLTCPGSSATSSELRPLGIFAGERSQGYEQERPQLSEAAVVCEIPSGDSSIEIRYEQLAGLDEEGVSYFTSSWFRRFFYYELAPLKEWALSETFKLNFQLTIPDEPIGFFRSIFFADPVVICQGDKKDLETSSRSASGDNITYSYLFGKNFPDRLHCEYQIDDIDVE